MSGKSNSFETSFLGLVLQNGNIANIGDATGLRGSSTAGSLYLALHTGDPGEAGTQSTSEISYTGYARVAVARNSSEWTVSGDTGSNTNAIAFAQCTGGSGTATHWSIGVASSGAGGALFTGPLATGRRAFTATAADVLTVPSHSLIVNDQVVAYAVPGATLPTGLTEGTAFFVKTVSGNDITLSGTQGGATLDLTTVGAGVILKLSSLAISQNITPTVAAGALTIVED